MEADRPMNEEKLRSELEQYSGPYIKDVIQKTINMLMTEIQIKTAQIEILEQIKDEVWLE